MRFDIIWAAPVGKKISSPNPYFSQRDQAVGTRFAALPFDNLRAKRRELRQMPSSLPHGLRANRGKCVAAK